MAFAKKLLAAAKAKRITPGAAKRLAAAKPFARPERAMTKLATAGMPRARAAPRAPRPFGMPRRRSPRG
jgi:hypothetical protein